MAKPRIFLGSSGKQAKLLDALTRGLAEVADVEPWTATFNPGTTTLGRLVELTRQVDFAAFIFAQDDWTSIEPATAAAAGQASPRDTEPTLNARTSGVYLRAEADDLEVLDGRDDQARAVLIAARIEDWKSHTGS